MLFIPFHVLTDEPTERKFQSFDLFKKRQSERKKENTEKNEKEIYRTSGDGKSEMEKAVNLVLVWGF